jgi:hypothetical protein
VVILNDAPPLLAHRVLSQGRLVFGRSRAARVRFQVRTAARYLDLVPGLETHIRALKRHAGGAGAMVDRYVVQTRLAKINHARAYRGGGDAGSA